MKSATNISGNVPLSAQNTELRQALLEQEQLHDERLNEIASQAEKISMLEARIQWFERQFNLERARQFAPTTEAAHSLQADLFNEAERILDQSAREDEATEEDAVEVPAHKRSKKTRKLTISDDLVRDVVEHDLDEAARRCAHDGSVLEPIGYEARRELIVVPQQVYAVEHRYIKYAGCDCGQCIKTTPREPRISKGLCSPQAAAAIAVNKFVDHQPLYRQSQQCARSGLRIDRATMARWMIAHGQAIQCLINLCRDQIMDYPYQQVDETGQKVLGPRIKGKRKGKKRKRGSHKGYFWVQRGGPPESPVVLYSYDPSRAGRVANELLTGYKGCVQTDAYDPYFKVMIGLSLLHALCNAHARRRFVDAIKAIDDPAIAEHSQSMVAIKFYKRLYRIEEELREEKTKYEDIEQWYQLRLQRRQNESKKIWKDFIAWADKELRTVRPKSHLGAALGYLIKYKVPLAVYLENPLVEIDNNLVENRIRPVALGRKNWLFSDTEHGAKASGNLYSLINTAMLNGHNPFTYLVHVFKELPAANSIEEMEALLPWNLNPDTMPSANPFGNTGK